MLTVTARNKRHTHRSHHPEMLNNNIDDGFISAFATKKPLESSLSRERAAKEAEKITVPLRSRMRKSRKRCLVPMVIITILILSGLLSAVIFILVNPIQKGEYIDFLTFIAKNTLCWIILDKWNFGEFHSKFALYDYIAPYI